MDDFAFRFSDRAKAGVELAERLLAMSLDQPIIYALPRGGVPVAVEVARILNAPLDLIQVRKIGAPGNPEVALGAIVEGPNTQMIINEDVSRLSGADSGYIERALAQQKAELERSRVKYLGDRLRLNATGRTVVVVDDGLATGTTLKAALAALKRSDAARIVVALPVAPKRAVEDLAGQADDIVCLHPATEFRGVGGFYRDFHQLSDDETIALLEERWTAQQAEPPRQTGRPHSQCVQIPPLGLVGNLVVPKNPRGIILFAQGGESSRLSPRNNFVACELNVRGFATLLFDLLTPAEGEDRRNAFDIPLLADRVVDAFMWAASEPGIADLPLGLFGASTGAGAALVAAAELTGRVAAVVSRGGRPDLAARDLPDVSAPALLIVGSLDHDVISLNKQALAALTCEKALRIVPGAGHVFEEPGTLPAAIAHAAEWFEKYLAPRTPRPVPPPAPIPEIAVLRAAAEPLAAIDDPEFAAAFDQFGSHRVVFLGESSHGTSEFCRARAAITRSLIEKHGFSNVAVEADWPDASVRDCHIRDSVHRRTETLPFARFPTWMWRNAAFQAFTEFSRDHNRRYAAYWHRRDWSATSASSTDLKANGRAIMATQTYQISMTHLSGLKIQMR